jgi:hypothetical protein
MQNAKCLSFIRTGWASYLSGSVYPELGPVKIPMPRKDVKNCITVLHYRKIYIYYVKETDIDLILISNYIFIGFVDEQNHNDL